MTNNDREIVSALRASLADKVGNDRYEVWFGPTQLHVRGETLLVVVGSSFIQDWMRGNLRKELEAAALETLGKPVKLEFRVEAAIEAAAQKPAAKVTPVTEPCLASSVVKHPATKACLPRRRFHCLDSYVVGSSNRLAYTSARLVAENPGSMSPLLVHGPSGVGKSHLLEGIWTGFKKTHPNEMPIYLSAEQFTSFFLEALHGSGLPNFRRKHRDVGLLIIDDIQFFAGKKATLIELQHTIDSLLRHGRQIVFAADRGPEALKSLGSDMLARLSGGVNCPLAPPEYQTRLGIVGNLAAQFSMTVPDDVQAFIAGQFTSQARELSGALKRLQATSMAHGKPVTLALAQEALADLLHYSIKVVKLPDIEKAVCDVLGLESDSLQSDRKDKSHSQPRMLAMFLARKHTRAALSEIGHFFGGRAHSTVISANHKIEGLIANGGQLDVAERSWNVDDLVRRVEENLRAG